MKKYEGDVNGLQTRIVDKNISNLGWNKHLPVPLAPEEVVYIHPDQSDVKPNYVKIIHGEDKCISVFSNNTLDEPNEEIHVFSKSAVSDQLDSDPTEDSEPVKPANKKPKPTKSGILFNGAEHTKSGLVLEVVKQYVIDHGPLDLAAVKEAFPDSLLRRFGIVQEISVAKSISKGGARYFYKESHQIGLSDCVAVVCNQITSDNIKPFIARAVELGYSIGSQLEVSK